MTLGADRLRPGWGLLPRDLRVRIVEVIGGHFVSDSSAHGGFSASYAGVVTTTGGRAFVKACAADWHADSLRFVREEIRVASTLPPHLGPAVLSAIDTDAGAALVLEAIDGRHPGAPWTAGDLDAVAARLARQSATPAPFGMERAEERMIPGFTRWATISQDPRLLAALPRSLRTYMPRLLSLESGFRTALRGDVIVHDDLRADNILIADGEARFLDWPHARRGAPWVDLPCFLPSVEASGGPRCEEAWRIFEAHGAPTPGAMLPVISGFASFLWFQQAQPEIPQLPGLRTFQRRQAVPALRWLATLLPIVEAADIPLA